MSTGFSDMRRDLRLQGWSAALAAIVTLLSFSAFGQGASNWRVYKAADGLPESTCISVTVAPHGKVLVRHLDLVSISSLDGYGVSVMPGPETGNGRVYESPGGQLWTVVREGLEEFDGGRWTLYHVPEITAEFQAVIPRPIDPVPLCPVRQGLVVFLLRDGLWEFNAEDPTHVERRLLGRAAKTHIGRFSGLTPARDGGLWVAGERGLAKVPAPLSSKNEAQWQEFLPPASLGISGLLEVREVQPGALVVVAESAASQQKVIVFFDGQNWKLEATGSEKIRHGWRGSDRTWWATTADSLLEWDEGRTDLQENEEIWASHYYDLALEPGGAFWLATSDGLFRYAPLAWRIPPPAQAIHSLVHCIGGDKEGRIWFATANGLYSLLDTQLDEHPFPPRLDRTLQAAHTLFVLGNGSVLLETPDQLFQFDPATGSYKAAKVGAAPAEFKALGTFKDGTVCVLRTLLDSSERRCELERYDGTRFETFSNEFSEACRFGLRSLFAARNGDLWFGGERGVAWYHDQKWQTFASTNQSAPVEASGFLELADGAIWCAGRDRIWEFDGRDWFTIRSGFDRINGILRTQDGSIWVASNNGVHRFFHGAWIENGPQEGLPGAGIRQVYEDQRGRIWAGTTHGLSLYHPDADPDPPRSFIGKLPDPENKFPEGRPIVLTFGGRDKWQYTPAERLLFSYRLDERDWSAFSDARSVPFDDLPAGKHYFQVRAMDRNGNITGQGPLDPKPAKVEFMVALPWYKETRLVLVSIAALATALFFAGLAFNRHLQLVRGYAVIEEKIEQRTRELEIANRELLHSQKMNALGTLAAGIAHDFNNILSIIKGSAQIIEDNLDNPRKISARLDRIKTVVDQGADIVKAMLGFGRESDTQPSLCDLNAVVDDTVKLLGDRFLREVRVRFLPGEALPPIAAPRGFIQQILLNFVFNAAESMPAHKQVNVRTAALTRLPPMLALAPGQATTYVGVSVEDFGCGIPPENLPRIFEPFFTTKAFSARRGTGLGLSMAYELAKKIGAGLAVESVPGRGSTFTLILPLQPPKAPDESQETAKMKATA